MCLLQKGDVCTFELSDFFTFKLFIASKKFEGKGLSFVYSIIFFILTFILYLLNFLVPNDFPIITAFAICRKLQGKKRPDIQDRQAKKVGVPGGACKASVLSTKHL